MMSQALRKLTSTVSQSNTVCIFINQVRENIGVMFGNPEVTPGGRALKFFSSVRIETRGGPSRQIKSGDEVVGLEVMATVKKNKVGPPLKKASYRLMYGEGIDYEDALLNAAVDLEVIERGGAWYKFDEDTKFQGAAAAVNYLRENPDKYSELTEMVFETLHNPES